MSKYFFIFVFACLFGLYIGRTLFPKRIVRTEHQVIEHYEVKLDTVRIKNNIFIEKVRPERIVLSPVLKPPDVIFPSYDIQGLWRVKCGRKLEAWGFKIEDDSIRTFYENWKINLGRGWTLEPNFKGERSYYTLLQKRFYLRPFWGLGIEYRKSWTLYLCAGIRLNRILFYGRADFRGLAVGVSYSF